MRRILPLLALLAFFAAPAHAACYADYKAKKDNPLQLHYGVIELPEAACNAPRRARNTVARRIAADGWQLLNIMSTFGPEGLDQRRASAANFFLRY